MNCLVFHFSGGFLYRFYAFGLLVFVHYILRFVVQECLDVGDADVDEALAGFLCCPCDVWGEEAVLGHEEGIAFLGGFDGDDIGAECGYLAFVECCGYVGFVDYRTAAGVDEDG